MATDRTLDLLDRLLAIMERGGVGEPQEIFTACSDAISAIQRLEIMLAKAGVGWDKIASGMIG